VELPEVNVLALDTSTIRGLVGLSCGDGRRLGTATDPGSRHGRSLVPTIRALLDEAGLGVADLSRVAVGLGPGSYTGLRIGLAAAKTLAYATGVELAGFDSLELYATVPTDSEAEVAVVADAQRGELYLARFGPGPQRARLGPTAIVGRGALEVLAAGTWLVGPALERTGARWPEHLIRPEAVGTPPSVETLLELAAGAEIIADFWDLEPSYLRQSAAEDKWTAPAPRVGPE
jgi:tRNA threonylcarbamoyladenosine biosynthesis protein TsaB